MKTFWNDKSLLGIEINRVKKAYDENPIEITEDTKQSDVIDYLKYIRHETSHGLHDSWKLLQIALKLETL